MAILTCERCGTQTAKLQPCDYCQKKQCIACIKSIRRKSKQQKIYICKTCWGSIPTRRKFKATAPPGYGYRPERER